MFKHEEFGKKMRKWLDFFNETSWKFDCHIGSTDYPGHIAVDYDFDERSVSFGVPEDARLSSDVLDRIAFTQVCMMLFYAITVDSEDSEDSEDNAVAALNVTRTFAQRMDECVYPVLRAVMQTIGRA